MEIDLITTALPDELWEFAGSNGFYVGGRLDSLKGLETRGIDVNFIDMHWEQVNETELIAACKRHSPEYAVAGDYSRDGLDIDAVNSLARQVEPYVNRVIVVPHGTGQVAEVPEFATVGLSVATSYASSDVPLIEYHGNDLHLMGGAPEKQMELYERYTDDVISADSNYVQKIAYKQNRWWSQTRDKFSGRKTVALDPLEQDNPNVESARRSLVHWSYAWRELLESESMVESPLEW